jgi:hypothetical protein
MESLLFSIINFKIFPLIRKLHFVRFLIFWAIGRGADGHSNLKILAK